MKAIVYTEFGPPDVLKVNEVEKPAPGDNEILIRVHAATVSYGDLVARNFKNIPASEFHMPLPLLLPSKVYFGLTKPRVNILGSECAGEVAEIGREVKRFKPGDHVFAYLGQRMGAYAEYVIVPEDGMVETMPAGMSFAEAATLPYGAIMAASILRKVIIEPGDRVLVNGASGGIGSAAVQLAKHDGAHVTGVCGSPRVEYVKGLGADRVIDYTKEDFTQNGEKYDLIFDVLGKSSYSHCKVSLKPDGTYLLASFKMKAVLQMLRTNFRLGQRGRQSGKRVICAMASENRDDLAMVRDLCEAGYFKTIIDRSFPMEEASEAHRYVESGDKKGQVVITFAMETSPVM